MEHKEITVFQRSIETCADPAEIARKVKLAFKRMPGEMALACFAKVMTAELSHRIKVAVWDVVRYSHIWWGVDEVLHGAVMENPTVQQAFADAVPMRRWIVANRLPGWEITQMTVGFYIGMGFDSSQYSPLQMLIYILTSYDDDLIAAKCLDGLTEKNWRSSIATATICSGISPIATTSKPPVVSPARKPLPRCWRVVSIHHAAITSACAGTTSSAMSSGRICSATTSFLLVQQMV